MVTAAHLHQDAGMLRLKNTQSIRLIAYFVVIVLMANLNALVDKFAHPGIPYLDEEHLLVGSISAFVIIVLVGLLELYLYSLYRAHLKIKNLESFLSICASCKKIRIPGADPEKIESWLPVESYISKRTSTIISHGICPKCEAELYSQ